MLANEIKLKQLPQWIQQILIDYWFDGTDSDRTLYKNQVFEFIYEHFNLCESYKADLFVLIFGESNDQND
jgi:hypothetical protein